MNGFLSRLESYWFAPAPAERLAVLRVATGLFVLWYLGQRIGMLADIALTDPKLFAPVGLATFLAEPLAPNFFGFLVWLTLTAGAAYTVGWRYRISGPAFGVLLMFVLCYRNSWSMLYHSDNLLAFHVLILGFTAAADAWSADAAAGRVGQVAKSAYGWPIRLICAITAIGYFLAGVAKVLGDLGWSWALGSSLRSQVAVDAMRKELLGADSSPLAYALYGEVELFTVLAVGSLIFELGAPIALLSRRAGYLWAVNAFLMHWGIFAIMDIRFRYQMCGVLFFSFFPIERAIDAIRRWSRWPAREARRSTAEAS